MSEIPRFDWETNGQFNSCPFETFTTQPGDLQEILSKGVWLSYKGRSHLYRWYDDSKGIHLGCFEGIGSSIAIGKLSFSRHVGLPRRATIDNIDVLEGGSFSDFRGKGISTVLKSLALSNLKTEKVSVVDGDIQLFSVEEYDLQRKSVRFSATSASALSSFYSRVHAIDVCRGQPDQAIYFPVRPVQARVFPDSDKLVVFVKLCSDLVNTTQSPSIEGSDDVKDILRPRLLQHLMRYGDAMSLQVVDLT